MMAALFITGSAHAQHLNIGIKGGVNVYNVQNDNNTEADPKLGLHFGLLGHMHLSDQFAFQPELLYSMQGSQQTVAGTDVKTNLNYLNMPLLLQYMFDNGFRLEAGPQLGLLLSAKTNIDNSDFDIEDNYEKTDVGIAMGIGYVNPATGFGIDARYNHGLSSINAGGSISSFNRGFQVGVFYLFNHKN